MPTFRNGTTGSLVSAAGTDSDGAAIQAVALAPATGGGLTGYRNIDLGTTGQVVKSSAGQLYTAVLSNRGTGERFVKFYDKATAATSSDTPVSTVPLAPGESLPLAWAAGLTFSAGISVRACTGVADADNTAPTANDVVVSLGYK